MPDTATLDEPFNGVHYTYFQDNLPDWLIQTAPFRIAAFQATPLNDFPPYPHATPEQHHQLKTAIADHWHRQNLLDKRFAGLNDVSAFAEPLLKAALSDYGDVDVRNTYLRLYVEAAEAWWTINVTGAQTSKTVSLLEAALGNFAAANRFLDFAFLGPQDARGQRDILSIPHRTTGVRLTAERFKSICRTLDIGAQYQRKLTEALGFHNPTVARALRDDGVARQKAALKSAAHMALVRGDLKHHGHDALLKLVDDRPGATLDGAPLQAYTLSLMNVALVGIVLFINTPGSRVIAYVAEDPDHPLKEYPSPLAFMQELTRQMRDRARYQVFFSQFVPHRERGAFFAGLNARLSQVIWHQKARTDSGPSWKDTPISDPNLHFSVQHWQLDDRQRLPRPATDTLWHYLFRTQLNKVVNDARDIAWSTADVERRARRAWGDNLEQMLSDILSAALLVLTPFVPGLGELMLAYSAYQVLDEVCEGIVDWAQGRRIEAWEHALGVADSVGQLSAPPPIQGARKSNTIWTVP